MSRKPSSNDLYCESTRSSYSGICVDPAVWIIYWGDPVANEVKTNYACASHLHKILQELTPKAEFCSDMFRVIPASMLLDWLAKQGSQS
ncbi:hypothetical protein OG730_42400 (plasmid) [Streptomyces sp. NBC_01298]|uniref:hypothetical protein n=1 Tax=Streptomyces sp. NBC_01298 TaxID=2903817 RepID=UPI002E135E51|nr:hypothetical protein OG730_42400 [Streptomyces sp. NBC_01298]